MIAQLETHLLALIDNAVEQASEDELFAGGYLRGHITLAVAQLEETMEDPPVEALQDSVSASIDDAIKNGELSPPDQALVRNMWHSLYHQALSVT